MKWNMRKRLPTFVKSNCPERFLFESKVSLSDIGNIPHTHTIYNTHTYDHILETYWF